MAVKITDVAKYANVSPAVVSRVLHDSGYVAKEKKELVKIAIEKLGYVPNQVAQGLKTQKSKMIGHILPSTFPNPFYSGISYGVDIEATELEYHVLTLFSYGDADREKTLIDEMASRMVDGIIFTGAASIKNVKKVIKLGLPVTMIERTFGLSDIDKVLVDNIEGSHAAVDYLIKMGHQKIGYIGVSPTSDVELDRYKGYIGAMEASNIPVLRNNIKFSKEYSSELGYRMISELLRSSNPPTAVFAASDIFVIGILQFLYKYNIRVPEELSIIGYDNSLAELFSPKITTIGNPMEEMGRTAVKLMINRFKNREEVYKDVTLHTTLIERESVKRLYEI
jgi:DNA-binding LacI/PurR family transcriptional regulator